VTTLANWQLAGILCGLLVAVTGPLFFAVRWNLDRVVKHLDGRLDAVLGEAKANAADINKVKIELLEFKAEIARGYVQREDWIRFGTSITAKIDALGASVDSIKERVSHGPIGSEAA
jgi:hypothetical protein